MTLLSYVQRNMISLRVEAKQHRHLSVALAFAAIYLIWGTTYLAIRVAVGTIPPFLMAGVRFIIAGLLTFAFLRARGAPMPSRRQWRSALIVGALLLVGGNGLVTWSEQQVPSGIAALVVATVPLWISLFDWLRRGGVRPGTRTAAGLLLGFAGIALLIGPDLLVEASIPWSSWLVLLMAPFFWSVGSLYSRQAELPANAFMSTAAEMLAGGVMLTVAGALTGEVARLDLAAVSLNSLVAMAYLTVFGSIVALTAYVWLLKNVQATRVATYTYVNPIIALILGWLILSEPITPLMVAAMVIIILAVVLITAQRPAHQAAEIGPEQAGKTPA